MKKIMALCMSIVLCFSLTLLGSAAVDVKTRENTTYSPEIPDQMQPLTIIRYVDSENFETLRGGPALKKTVISLPSEQLAMIQEAKANGSYYTAIREEYPKPVKGVTVVYGSDGFINKINFPEGVKNPLLEHKSISLPSMPFLPPATGSDADSAVTSAYTVRYIIASWGSYPNTLYQDIDPATSKEVSRYGWGRGTTFSDAKGQANISNYKGCVATKLAYDDCKVNLAVQVTTKIKAAVQLRYQ